MTSSAISGLSAALYRDDPTVSSTAFSNLALTHVAGSGYTEYQAASGYRYWDRAVAPVIQYKLHGSGSWTTLTPDEIRFTKGSVYFSVARNSDDTFQALSGSRRAEATFVKIMNMYAGKLTINGKEIDITSIESGGWSEFIMGPKTFEFTSEAFFYYYAVTFPEINTRDLTSFMYAKFYSNYTGAKSWVGYGMLKSIDLILNDPNDAQKETLTFAGTNEIFPEL
jgi:hypothetical protein